MNGVVLHIRRAAASPARPIVLGPLAGCCRPECLQLRASPVARERGMFSITLGCGASMLSPISTRSPAQSVNGPRLRLPAPALPSLREDLAGAQTLPADHADATD